MMCKALKGWESGYKLNRKIGRGSEGKEQGVERDGGGARQTKL